MVEEPRRGLARRLRPSGLGRHSRTIHLQASERPYKVLRQEPSERHQYMESRNAEVDGIRMRWEEQGEGRPVVFVHGIPTSPDSGGRLGYPLQGRQLGV